MTDYVTPEVVLAEISVIEEWRSMARIAALYPCSHCGAAVDEPCRIPPGSRTRTHHLARDKRAATTYRSAMPNAWRGDLIDGVDPRRVLKEVRSCRLYRRLGELGRLLRSESSIPTIATGEGRHVG